MFLLELTPTNRISFVLPFSLDAQLSGLGDPTTFSSSTPLPVPDLGTLDSVVTVANIPTALAMAKIAVYITHTNLYDLRLSLVAPDGTEILLSSNNGGGGHDYGHSCDETTVFSDDALSPINTGTAPFVGEFKPEQTLAALVGKEGAAINGEWKLRVRDVVSLDSGVLQCWSLELTPLGCFDGGGQCLMPPTIVQGPASQTVTNGDTVQFEVLAQGDPPLSFQWYHGSAALSGETNSVLTLVNVLPSQAGEYRVVVANPYGEQSSSAILTIIEHPTIACASDREWNWALLGISTFR
jgi:subtilisin-like proprotein convertase family protein